MLDNYYLVLIYSYMNNCIANVTNVKPYFQLSRESLDQKSNHTMN